MISFEDPCDSTKAFLFSNNEECNQWQRDIDGIRSAMMDWDLSNNNGPWLQACLRHVKRVSDAWGIHRIPGDIVFSTNCVQFLLADYGIHVEPIFGNIPEGAVELAEPNDSTKTFIFVNHQQAFRWNRDISGIRHDAAALNRDHNRVKPWLQNVKRIVDLWGVHRIPCDVVNATNTTENNWATYGNHVPPIFRNSIPKLINALCEHTHACKGSSFVHVYFAKNGDIQTGYGVPELDMVAHERNKLKKVEITYIEYDGNEYTIRTDTVRSGIEWRKWIIALWEVLSLTLRMVDDEVRESNYRGILTTVTTYLASRTDHDAIVPPSIRAVIHELQDRFNVPRTTFGTAV